MKFYAIQGSPRKNWNDDQLLDSFIEGIHSKMPDAEVEKIYVYDYGFKGCRSCFGCKLKTNRTGECVIRDDIHDLLIDIRGSDGFVMASPVYFLDITGQLHAFLERLMYPGPTEKKMTISTIYTMNAGEDTYKKMIKPSLDIIHMYFKANFHADMTDVITAHDTLQRKNNDLYVQGHTDHSKKEERHKTQWPQDLGKAFNAGVHFAEEALIKKDVESMTE